MFVFSTPVYAIYPGPLDGPEDVELLITTWCEAGVGVIQYREKRLRDASTLAVARRVTAAARPFGVPVLVNDRADIARLSGAHGVHLGQEDLRIGDVKRLLGPGGLVGVSVDTSSEAMRAEAEGADYVSLGPAYPTATKTDVPDPRPPGLFRQIAADLRVPLVAIGGISAQNVGPLAEAGVASAAVISWLLEGGLSGDRVRELTRAFRAALPGGYQEEQDGESRA